MTLRRALQTVGPVDSRIEPLRGIRSRKLTDQHITHFIVIIARSFFIIETIFLPAPVCPAPG